MSGTGIDMTATGYMSSAKAAAFRDAILVLADSHA
jgi:hypothetical protein